MRDRRCRERAAPVRNADLVGHDGELVALGREPSDRQQEIPAAQSVHPARAQHERMRADGGDRALALELARPVHVERRWRRVFRIRCGARPVEHVVRGKMNEHRGRALRLFGEDARRDAVDRARRSGSDSARSTAVYAPAFTISAGSSRRTSATIASGSDRSSIVRSAATTSPTGASSRESSKPIWPSAPVTRIFGRGIGRWRRYG